MLGVLQQFVAFLNKAQPHLLGDFHRWEPIFGGLRVVHWQGLASRCRCFGRVFLCGLEFRIFASFDSLMQFFRNVIGSGDHGIIVVIAFDHIQGFFGKIAGSTEEIDMIRDQLDFFVADQVKQVLGRVCDPRQMIKFQKACTPFHGVE